MLKRGEKAPPPKSESDSRRSRLESLRVTDPADPQAVKPQYPGRPGGRPGNIEIDPMTGDVKGSDRA